MSKLVKLFRAVLFILRKPSLLNLILDSNDVKESAFKKLFPALYPVRFLDFNRFFEGTELQTFRKVSFLDGGSSVTDYALLRQLHLLCGNESYFEIGTWRGESAMIASETFSQVYTLNLSDKQLSDLGLPADYVGAHRFFSSGIQHITHLFGNSAQFDFSPYRGKMNLVFVDGDHHYESVLNDTQKAFELVKTAGGIIVWHDAGFGPEDYRYEVLQAIFEGAPEHARDKIFRVSHTRCCIYLPEPDLSWVASNSPLPASVFSVSFKKQPV